MTNFPLTELAGLTDNDPLRLQARNLIARLLNEAEFLINNGSPQVKAQLIRAVVPQMVKALREERKESDEMLTMQAQLRELQQAMVGIQHAPVMEPGTKTVAEDSPMPAMPEVAPPRLETPQSRRKGSSGGR